MVFSRDTVRLAEGDTLRGAAWWLRHDPATLTPQQNVWPLKFPVPAGSTPLRPQVRARACVLGLGVLVDCFW